MKRIVVTGASGFLGRNVMPVLIQHYGADSVVGLSSRDYDLTNPRDVRRMFEEKKPDVLIHLAGYVGGIGANREYPADFFYRNILLTALVFQAAAEYKVSKMIYMIGSCSYPATAKSPIDEDQMWAGYPQQESAAYAMAKKMGLVASAAYRQQYGLRSVILILGNVYGIYDNFREKEAHVIPALIHRFYKAKLSGAKQVIVWGSGKPERDFVYARDVAATLPFFIEKYNQDEPVNISSGTGTSIKSLAEMIKDLVGYRGEIIWDTSKPDGQMVKILDVRRMKSLGLSCPTTLYNGLKETINWFSKNYATRGDGIRL